MFASIASLSYKKTCTCYGFNAKMVQFQSNNFLIISLPIVTVCLVLFTSFNFCFTCFGISPLCCHTRRLAAVVSPYKPHTLCFCWRLLTDVSKKYPFVDFPFSPLFFYIIAIVVTVKCLTWSAQLSAKGRYCKGSQMIHGTLSGFHRSSFVLSVCAVTAPPTALPAPMNTRLLWSAQTHIH